MPRRKFLSPGVWSRQRKPHAKSFPPGLWWYRSLSADQSARVLQEYLEQRGKRGAKKLPPDFPKKLELWMSELTTNQGTKTKVEYWTLKGYALRHRISLFPFMAWFRTLEEVAKDLYPEWVPVGRRDKTLTEETIQAIRTDYLNADYSDRKAVKKIAAKYRIGTFRVGQLCRNEKQQRREEMERRQAAHEGANATQSQTEPFGEFNSEEETF